MQSDLDLGIYLTQKDVAELLGISPQAVSKVLKEHEIPTVKKGNRLQVLPPASFAKLLALRGIRKEKNRIALHVVKGGVGKTTLTHGLGARAAALSFRTLLIDLDQQANLSHSFGIYPELGKDPTLLNVYTGKLEGKKITVKDSIVKITEYLHIIPSNLTLANFDATLLMGNDNISTLLEDLLSDVLNDYDLILLDCPPALSKVTSAAHCFADKIIMPVTAAKFALEGLQLTIEHLAILKKNFKVNPDVSIVLNMCVAQQKLTFEVLKTLSEHYGNLLSETFISSTKKIENSLSREECIWKDVTQNNALEDMHNFLVDLLSLGHWSQKMVKTKVMRAPAIEAAL